MEVDDEKREGPHQQQWRFSMELLSNVHTLRLYLLSSSEQSWKQCLSVSAKLLSPSPSLSCTWVTLDGTLHSATIPLPLLLFDYGVPPHATARLDHIEVSLRLLAISPLHLPLVPEHPEAKKEEINGTEGGGSFRSPSSSLHQGLELHEEVFFSCKNCSVTVLKNPIREFVELPCVDWREVVEHWFGTCCCSFGSRAESISASYEKSLSLGARRCLVGSSTFVVDRQDLDSSALVEQSTQKQISPVQEGGGDEDDDHSKAEFVAIGNGFMVWENQLSKSTEWLPVCCACCSFPLGARPYKRESHGGMHLFRCQVSALNSSGKPCGAYRDITFERLFAKELLVRIEENASHRFLIRSLSSKLPLLQLVVLNCESLTAAGFCDEILTPAVEKRAAEEDAKELQRSVKFMFRDCSRASVDEARCIEQWEREHDTEVIYMLDEVAYKLITELTTNGLFFPPSCGSLEHMRVSFLLFERV